MVSETEIFKNSEAALTLIKDGVVKIPFLNQQELKDLKDFYQIFHQGQEPPTVHDGMHMTIWHSDYNYKINIKKGIREIIQPAFERSFKNYRSIGHQFIVKNPGPETAFHMHQDWNIVDETQHFSMNVWIPLQDVDSTNGAMWIVKGSHKSGNHVRGAGLLFPNYFRFFDQLKPYMTSFPMKAGEALVFYHASLHGSPVNQNQNPRVIIQASLLHQETPLQVYFKKNTESPLEIHHPDDEIGLHYKNIREESSLFPPTPQATEKIYDYTVQEIDIQKVIKTISR